MRSMLVTLWAVLICRDPARAQRPLLVAALVLAGRAVSWLGESILRAGHTMVRLSYWLHEEHTEVDDDQYTALPLERLQAIDDEQRNGRPALLCETRRSIVGRQHTRFQCGGDGCTEILVIGEAPVVAKLVYKCACGATSELKDWQQLVGDRYRNAPQGWRP